MMDKCYRLICHRSLPHSARCTGRILAAQKLMDASQLCEILGRISSLQQSISLERIFSSEDTCNSSCQ